jgi:hypothetical protein
MDMFALARWGVCSDYSECNDNTETVKVEGFDIMSLVAC